MYRIKNLFLSVGAAKSGTTWIYRQLHNHPELWTLPVKEIHYLFSVSNDGFDRLHYNHKYNELLAFVRHSKGLPIDELRKKMHWYMTRYLDGQQNDQWFCNLYADNLEHKICVDFSNSTALINEQDWSRVSALADNVKLLYTLREPVQRLWSHVNFHMQFVGKQDEMKAWSEKNYIDFANNKFVMSDGLYAENIQRILTVFPQKDLKIKFYEDMKQKPAHFINDIEEFLNIAQRKYDKGSIFRRINPTLNKSEVPDYFVEKFAPYAQEQAKRLEDLGLIVPKSWKKCYK